MPNKIDLTNNFGETTENYVVGGTSPAIAPIAAKTVVGNSTTGAAVATAVPMANLAGLQVLTGLVAGTNVAIAATDTLLVALAKLQAQISAL